MSTSGYTQKPLNTYNLGAVSLECFYIKSAEFLQIQTSGYDAKAMQFLHYQIRADKSGIPDSITSH